MFAVERRDFKSKLFEELLTYMITLYEKKKNQREIVFETSKKEHEGQIDNFKAKNLYGINNTKLKHLLSKPAIQGLNRHVQREKHIVSTNESSPFQYSASPKTLPLHFDQKDRYV